MMKNKKHMYLFGISLLCMTSNCSQFDCDSEPRYCQVESAHLEPYACYDKVHPHDLTLVFDSDTTFIHSGETYQARLEQSSIPCPGQWTPSTKSTINKGDIQATDPLTITEKDARTFQLHVSQATGPNLAEGNWWIRVYRQTNTNDIAFVKACVAVKIVSGSLFSSQSACP